MLQQTIVHKVVCVQFRKHENTTSRKQGAVTEKFTCEAAAGSVELYQSGVYLNSFVNNSLILMLTFLHLKSDCRATISLTTAYFTPILLVKPMTLCANHLVAVISAYSAAVKLPFQCEIRATLLRPTDPVFIRSRIHGLFL